MNGRLLLKSTGVLDTVTESVSHPQICSLMRGGIAERGGVRVGHRIIEINGQSVVAMAHEKIVQNLSVSVGEVRTLHATRWQFSVITEAHRALSHTGLLKKHTHIRSV